jgi:hypothetical protein
VLRIRANCVLFAWVPELRAPTPGSTFSHLRGQRDSAHLNCTIIVASRKEVWGRVHDAIDGCAAGGLHTGFMDALPVYKHSLVHTLAFLGHGSSASVNHTKPHGRK